MQPAGRTTDYSRWYIISNSNLWDFISPLRRPHDHHAPSRVATPASTAARVSWISAEPRYLSSGRWTVSVLRIIIILQLGWSSTIVLSRCSHISWNHRPMLPASRRNQPGRNYLSPSFGFGTLLYTMLTYLSILMIFSSTTGIRSSISTFKLHKIARKRSRINTIRCIRLTVLDFPCKLLCTIYKICFMYIY